jgi:hypothetical protein
LESPTFLFFDHFGAPADLPKKAVCSRVGPNPRLSLPPWPLPSRFVIPTDQITRGLQLSFLMIGFRGKFFKLDHEPDTFSFASNRSVIDSEDLCHG